MLFTPFSRTWWKSLVKGETASSLSSAALDNLPDESLDESEEELESDTEESYHGADTDDGAEPFSADLANDDPLAPAYDLDRGAPLPPTAVQLPNPPIQRGLVRSAKDFFNQEILYRYDILDDVEQKELSGRYRLELKGYQGGVWTVLINGQLEVVNRREDAEIVITMHQKDFLQLVNGELNPQLAIFAQKMKVQGDLRRCISFDRILTPYVE